MSAVTFSPTHIDFDTFNRTVAEARRLLVPSGALTLDFSKLQHSNTAVLCFIIDILRAGVQHNARVSVANPPPALVKLMTLYQFHPDQNAAGEAEAK